MTTKPGPKFSDYHPIFDFVQGFLDEKDFWIAKIPEIPDCTASAESADKARLKLEREFNLIRKSYAHRKVPMPKPRKKP